jgi:ferredoxin-NADP reductase
MATVLPVERRPGTAHTITVEVLACIPAARDAVTLLLALPGTQRAPAPYRPGQFITLAFSAGQRVVYRSYSLCGEGRADTPWEITVKRHDSGLISTYLCRGVRPGALLRTSLPRGSFTLPATIRPDTPLIFVAGGSGITPIYGMLRALARMDPARRPRVWLHYTYHSAEDAIYGCELAALDPQRLWLAQRQYVAMRGDRLRPEHVLAEVGVAGRGAEWYICGPAGLRTALETEARRQGVPAERIHVETFASPRSQAASAAPAGSSLARVHLAESGGVLAARPGETLLETLERHGYHPEFSCRAGACGTCRLRLLAGQVRNGAGGGLSAAERAAGYVLSCVAEPVGDVTVAETVIPHAAARSAQTTTGQRASRATTRRALRLGLGVAAASLFMTTWGLTSHTPATSSQTATGGTGGRATISSGDDGESTSGANGSSFFQAPSHQTVPNTSTGVS